MTLNVLDIVLVLVALAYAVAGFRQGFLVGAFGVVGLVGGGLGGALLAPLVLRQLDPGITVSITALAIVLVLALLGQALGAHLGAALRSHVTWRPAHYVDATAGAALSVVAALVVSWILGAAVATAHFGELARIVRGSQILSAVDQLVPRAAERAFLAFSQIVDPAIFPRYLSPFTPERIRPVDPPDDAVLADPQVEQAVDSVVKVVGIAPGCSRSLEGSGFVYADQRVLTNAHVVAGVEEPRLQTRDGREYDADVVVYDPGEDVAVLAVPGLGLPALELDEGGDRGDDAVVAGYPGGGPFSADAAKIRAEQRLRGPGIYGEQDVVREVFSLYADVRPGNSGGPLVSPDGTVWGMIFAASVEDENTGYALTAAEVEDNADAGRTSTEPVSTGRCQG